MLGQSKLNEPPWLLESSETTTLPVPFPSAEKVRGKTRPLAGIRVLELCRIIASPNIGRSLAKYSANMIKIISPHLSDVPFFQVDG